MVDCTFSVYTREGETCFFRREPCFAVVRSWKDRAHQHLTPVSVKYHITQGTHVASSSTKKRREAVYQHQKWLAGTMFGKLVLSWGEVDHAYGYCTDPVVTTDADPRAVFLTLVHLRNPHEYPHWLDAIPYYKDMVTVPEVGLMLSQYLGHAQGEDGIKVRLPGTAHSACSRVGFKLKHLRNMVKNRHYPPMVEEDTFEKLKYVPTPINAYYCGKEEMNTNGMQYTFGMWLLRRLEGVKSCGGDRDGWYMPPDWSHDYGKPTSMRWPTIDMDVLAETIRELERKVTT